MTSFVSENLDRLSQSRLIDLWSQPKRGKQNNKVSNLIVLISDY